MRHVKRITADDLLIMTLLKHMLNSNPNDRPDFKDLKSLYLKTRD